MTITIGLVCNLYNEANALPGWLETHLPFFDYVSVYHTGPNGTLSNDGTMEILKKWHIPVTISSIDEGFGVSRTRAIRSSPCEWVMLLDADERFYPLIRTMTCTGESTPCEVADDILYDYGNPNFAKDGPRNQIVQAYDGHIKFASCPSNFENLKHLGANLTVEHESIYNQGAALRRILEDRDLDAVQTIRRHWHDFSFQRPTQNWHINPDYQKRIVRNSSRIYFAPDKRMHESLIGAESCCEPTNLFFDHFHIWFKIQEVEQRNHDVAIYNAIHEGKRPPTWEEFNKVT